MPKLWLRYKDDTFVIQQAEHSHQFLRYINSLDTHIQFTTENSKEDGSIHFLDILVSPEHNNTLTTSIYRKPTHVDQYLHWDSNHNLPAKYSIYKTVAHRARVVYKSQQALKEEEDHIRQALLRHSYPPWTLNRLHTIINHRFNTNQAQMTDNSTTMKKPKPLFLWCPTPGGSVTVSRTHALK